eukprot:CAMPEP_0195300776 /NCGR_PEP_ID=MMETSP0707-20130614/28107_1 /TAXON_ID=33640 /ORGANISM="Asterionellopsis glacialis, Strain CCMP134" /LENGTH=316 /DNA_ID=CAMNT_0040363561 /DNA_START=180 /DNA_END=1127 /DNA_ORIENTATION=+
MPSPRYCALWMMFMSFLLTSLRVESLLTPLVSNRFQATIGTRTVSFAKEYSYSGIPSSQSFRCLQAATTSSTSGFAFDQDDDESTEDKNLDMPWTDFQEWALRDNLPKYLVSIPTKKSGNKQELFALWRTMTREVTELSGYPIDFLQEMHGKYLLKKLKEEEYDDDKVRVKVTPGMLPFLDEFEFATGGGVSGKAYGIPGIADGTKIETTGIKDVTATVPKGYVRTEDGSIAYELGIPLRDFYSLDGTSGTKDALLNTGKSVTKTANGALASSGAGSYQEDPDAMLLRLGASTGILLAGATAVNMLSHHLTVNVFW